MWLTKILHRPLNLYTFRYFFCDLSGVACPLSGHHGGEEVMWLGQHLVTPRTAQSPSWMLTFHI